MTPESLTGVVHRLRVAVDPVTSQRADPDLVRAVARYRDPAAFADIVRRHGPMVLGTCRRVLRDHADADDAFQATFLVFLRRAASLRRPERLAGWLFQVAYRTSQKLRAVRLARRGRETELFDLPGGEPPAEFIWRELRPIFDAELARLPDKLRLPAVLCLLEGRSKRDAARTLGWPEGTVAGRLQQARETLRRRFAARGLTLSAGALAVALFEGAGAVAVPPVLFASTIHGLAAGSASAGAAALADGVVHAMFVTKVKAITAAILLTGIVGTGTGVVLTPGTGPGVALADGPAKEKGPAPRDIPAQRQANEPFVELVQREARLVAIDGERDRHAAALRESYERRQKNLEAELATEPDAARRAILKKDLVATQEALQRLQVPASARVKELERLRNERVELQRELDKQREVAVLADLQAKNLQQKLLDLQHELEAQRKAKSDPSIPMPASPAIAIREGLVKKIEDLRRTEEMYRPLYVKGVIPKSDYDRVVADLARAQAELAIMDKELLARLVDPKAPVGTAAQRAQLVQDIDQLRDRKAYAERMVEKGFMTQAQLAADAARLAQAEALLAKLDAAQPRGPGPEKTSDELADRLREIDREKLTREVEASRERLKRMEELFRKGLVPQADVDAAKVQLAQAEIELRKLTPPPAADPKRAKLEETVTKLTEIFRNTEAGYKQKAVTEVEYLQAKLRKLRAEFEVLTLSPPDNHRELVKRLDALNDVALVADEIDQKLSQGFRSGAVSAVEARRSRVESATMKADLNDRVGQYDKAVEHREAAVRQLEELLEIVRAGVANDRFGVSDLRQFRLDMAEAKANLHRAQLRKQLAEIVMIRTEDLEVRKKLLAAGAIAVEDVRVLRKRANTGAAAQEEIRRAEQALAEARTKLAEER